MNRLPLERRVQVVRSLVEGTSVRSTVRLTGVAKGTILKLLAEVGGACARYQDRVMRDLRCRRLQLDEIWCFVYAKDKNMPLDKMGRPGFGSIWTWVAIDAETKLVPSWLVGLRDLDHAKRFVGDLAARLANRVQLTSDGLRVYLEAIEEAFGGEVDHGVLVKHYGAALSDETRYSPPECIGCDRIPKVGNPDPAHISTSFVERQNLTMRMQMRRFTRLTNAFSRKVANHAHAVALHYMHYNFARRHQTLRVTPAMAAGVDRRLWTVEDIVRLAD
jgi:IS1 family transposase